MKLHEMWKLRGAPVLAVLLQSTSTITSMRVSNVELSGSKVQEKKHFLWECKLLWEWDSGALWQWENLFWKTKWSVCLCCHTLHDLILKCWSLNFVTNTLQKWYHICSTFTQFLHHSQARDIVTIESQVSLSPVLFVLQCSKQHKMIQ